MAPPASEPRPPSPASFPRVPAHAWSWLQRSRPVLAEVAQRLSGQAPTAAFVDALPDRFAQDAFTRAIVCDVIAEVAFSGRVPPQRPSGASWDRGLVWWAATLSGTTSAEYDRRPAAGAQPRLFPAGDDASGRPDGLGDGTPQRAGRPRAGRTVPVRGERAALAAALRSLLAASDGASVPAESVRGLLAELEGD